QLAGQLRYDLEQIAHQAVIGYLEDRRFLVLVDRNNDLGVLHARQVLDGTGDADGDVQLRRNDLAGLADLHVVGYEAGVHRGTRGTDTGAQLVGQFVQHLEVVAVLHAAATGDHDLGTGQFGTVGLGQLLADEGGGAGVVGGADGFNGGTAPFGGDGVEAGGAHGDDLDRRVGLDGGDGVTGIDRALEGVGAFHGDDLGDLVDIQQGSDARQVVRAVGAGRGQDGAVAVADLGDQQGDVLRQQVGVGGVVGPQHLGDTGDPGGGVGHGATTGTGHQHLDVATDGLGSSHGVQGGGVQLGIVVFGNNQNRHVRSPWLRSSVCRAARQRS